MGEVVHTCCDIEVRRSSSTVLSHMQDRLEALDSGLWSCNHTEQGLCVVVLGDNGCASLTIKTLSATSLASKHQPSSTARLSQHPAASLHQWLLSGSAAWDIILVVRALVLPEFCLGLTLVSALTPLWRECHATLLFSPLPRHYVSLVRLQYTVYSCLVS